jgi:energy-converting hydrogenase Eha subunit H
MAPAMSDAVSGLIDMAMFMLVTVLVFHVLDIAWNTQVGAHEDFTRRLEDRHSADVDVEATTDTTTVANNGDTVVPDFTEMDLLVQYTDSGDTEVVS